MDVSSMDLDAAADQLRDALDVYERFATAWIEDAPYPPRAVAGFADGVDDGECCAGHRYRRCNPRRRVPERRRRE